MATDVVVVRVFVDDADQHGSPLGVVFDGPRARAERQRMAVSLAYSETVFVDDAARGVVDIYTPHSRLEFAGYPLVGGAWVLRERGHPVDAMRPPAGEVPVWMEGDSHWIRARTSWLAGSASTSTTPWSRWTHCPPHRLEKAGCTPGRGRTMQAD